MGRLRGKEPPGDGPGPEWAPTCRSPVDSSLWPDAPAATIALSPHPTSVGAARDHVRLAMRAWPCSASMDDAVLAADELVSNAIVHARTGFELTVRLEPTAVRVTVRDFSRGRPILFAVDADADGGRGLMLVMALAGSWHTEATATGKLVWCALPRHTDAETNQDDVVITSPERNARRHVD